MSAVDQALNDAFGQAKLATIYGELNQYYVIRSYSRNTWKGPMRSTPCMSEPTTARWYRYQRWRA